MNKSNFGPRTLFLTLIFVFMKQTLQAPDPDFLKRFLGFREECCKENGLEPDYVKKIWDSNHIPSNDTKLSCYYKCMNMKLGVLTEAGEVVDDMLTKVSAQFLDDAATETEITKECGGIDGKDLCQDGLKLMVCVKAAILD